MNDAEWLRGIADSGWNECEWSPEVKAMLRRVADRLDEDLAVNVELLAACERILAFRPNPRDRMDPYAQIAEFAKDEARIAVERTKAKGGAP